MQSKLIILTLSTILTLPAFAAKPQIQWDPEYDFNAVESFQWSDTDDSSIRERDPFLHRHIINAIEFQLTSHGLTETDSDPDVYVTYHMAIDTDIRVRSMTVGYGFGSYGRRSWRYWGYGIGGPIFVETERRTIEVERGSLMIDVWDAASNELIWRGVADDISVSDNPQKMRTRVEKAIEKMAKQYDKLRAREES